VPGGDIESSVSMARLAPEHWDYYFNGTVPYLHYYITHFIFKFKMDHLKRQI
jgi:hypothetical protein